MIRFVIDNLTSDDDGNIILNPELIDCVFCQKEIFLVQPVNFIFNGQDFLLNIPMCFNHFSIFDKKDNYHIKIKKE